jgi:hypothetical protein
LSLARTARELTEDNPQADNEPPIGSAGQADYSAEPEHTVWGTGWRLRPPVWLENSRLAWDLPASPLGSSPANWR